MKWMLPAVACLAAQTAAFGQTADIADRIDALGPETCADSDLPCVTLDVPRNHLGNDPEATLPITFAVSLATEDAKGTLIYELELLAITKEHCHCIICVHPPIRHCERSNI